MSTENIDDLFRHQLGDHATPPGDDLWSRMEAGLDTTNAASEPDADASRRLDQLYQQNLHTYATPPTREIWERLEDEHLRPQKRRTAAWWPLALAATVALLLLAGGAGLWRGFPGGAKPAGTMASRRASGQPVSQGQLPVSSPNAKSAGPAAPSRTALATSPTPETAGATAGAVATNQNAAPTSKTTISEFNQKNLPARATRPKDSAFSASKVGMLAQQLPRRPQSNSRQPDAAAASAPQATRMTASRHTPTNPANELAPAPIVAATNLPTSVSTAIPAGEIVPTAVVPTASLAAANLITVDVRNGAARRPSLASAVATAAAASEARQGLGGRLLRQVGHAVRGERLSLSEVTGLPENLTLEATFAGHRVSKSIQL